jgi:HSP20 family protein
MMRPYHATSLADSLVKDFFDDSWDVSNLEKSPNVGSLALDVKETDTHYELLMDAPGVDKENTKIEINNHMLTISVEKKKTDVTETEKLKRVERYVGKSSRSLRLGENIDEDKVEANYVDGVLHVKLAKKPVEALAKKVKTIAIQ